MSNTDDEKFVEKLLKDLPKSLEMSPLEIKRAKKHIELLVASEKQRVRSKRLLSQLSAAASVVILVAGFVVFTDSAEILDDTSPIVSSSTKPVTPKPVVSNNENSGTNDSNEQNTDPEEPNTNIGEYGTEESSKPNTPKKGVPVLRTGIDYEANLDLARAKVLPLVMRGSLINLSSAQIACSVELGIKESLFAIDRGVYAGESVEVYYFGSSKTDLKIKIVSYGCNFVAESGL